MLDLYEVIKALHRLKVDNEDLYDSLVEYFVQKGFDSEELRNIGIGRGTKFLYYLIQ